MYIPAIFEVRSFSIEVIAIEVLGGVANPISWGTEGLGDCAVRKSVGELSSYGPSIVTFPLSLRV